MTFFDVCNGDADGLFALRQWRLAHPEESIVVTGIKRDIALLARVEARAGDRVAVFDIAISRNEGGPGAPARGGVAVTLVRPSRAGPDPGTSEFTPHIDTDPEICTSLLVDRQLKGRFRLWAIAAAYGDNLRRARSGWQTRFRWHHRSATQLRMLGEAVNYNAYGDCEADVRIHPAALYRRLAHYDDPLRGDGERVHRARTGRPAHDDLARRARLRRIDQGGPLR